MVKPLDNLRVLDLTRLLPGGICTMLLADMGADVIKVEDPNGGDYARWMPPMLNGQGAFFLASNRDKRSIILDLKTQKGQAVLHRLVETADVLIEGFRPGVTARLNCDYEALKAVNPRLIYCSLSGWGQDGPYTHLSGHDLNYTAINGVQGSAGSPQPLGGLVADVGGSYVAVMGIMGALLKRATTGTGDYIDVALYEAGMPFAMYAYVESWMTGLRGGEGGLTGGLACYNVYTAGDGRRVALGALELKFWTNFCTAVQKPEWIPLHMDITEQATLKQEVGNLMATRNGDAWYTDLKDADCCFSLVVDPTELPNVPHIQARGMVGADAAGVPWMRSPVRFLSDAGFTPGTAPGYGEHTRAVLQESGYNEGEIESLMAEGILRQE